MRNIHFHHNALTAAEITTRRLCKLHRVTLFSPAICRVNRGSKVIVQGASEMLATPQQLIILPAEVELEVINQPENGLFCSDLLSLTPELLADFKHRYMSEPQTGRLTSLCAPLGRNCRLCGKASCRRYGRGSAPNCSIIRRWGCCWRCIRLDTPGRCSTSGART
jgi:hypothetical protein